MLLAMQEVAALVVAAHEVGMVKGMDVCAKACQEQQEPVERFECCDELMADLRRAIDAAEDAGNIVFEGVACVYFGNSRVDEWDCKRCRASESDKPCVLLMVEDVLKRVAEVSGCE